MLTINSLLEDLETNKSRCQMTTPLNCRASNKTGNESDLEEATRPCAISLRPDELRFLRPKEVAQVLGISRQQLWRMRRSGKFINPIRIGDNSVAYRSDELLEWMNSCQLVDENKKHTVRPAQTVLDEPQTLIHMRGNHESNK